MCGVADSCCAACIQPETVLDAGSRNGTGLTVIGPSGYLVSDSAPSVIVARTQSVDGKESPHFMILTDSMPRANADNRWSMFSIVIPAYNEESGIAAILERVLSVCPALSEVGMCTCEVIVVDDGSCDKTVEIVQGFVDDPATTAVVRVIRHRTNRGYGAALKTGFSQASGQLVAFLDADGTYPPEHFPSLCQAALSGADIVVGSRMSGETSQMPVMRRVGNLLFASLISLLSERRVSDSASGMRVIRRTALSQLYPLPDGLNFTPIMSLRAVQEGLRIVEVPIPYSERVGQSKLSVVRDGLRYTQSIMWTAMGYNPVRIFGTMGIAGIGLAGLVGLWLVTARFSGVTTLGPWEVVAIFAALVSGVSGISLFNLGATFNYLVALFRKRPVRMGLFGKPIFDSPLDRHFGWMGTVAGGGGLALAACTLALGLNGWEIDRLWLYLVGSALFILVGLQLVISWILMRILEELAEREILAQKDLLGASD